MNQLPSKLSHRQSARSRRSTKRPIVAGLVTTAWLILQLLAAKPILAQEKKPNTLSYGELLEQVERNKVVRVEIDPTQRVAKVTLTGDDKNPKTVALFNKYDELIEQLRENRIDVEVNPSSDNSFVVSLLVQLILVFMLIMVVMMFLRRAGAGPGQAMNFGKSRAKFQMEAKTGVMFDDVAGVEEAKEELQEVVTFLKKPERFTAIGARIPKGVLLIGPPGTGKTLLAKAIAGEAGVPFFSISGSEFVEMFVGVGASRVRDLFRKAKENSPCIVFIDEIDAVGRQRGIGIGGGNDEREQTLNQLLTEMDGFEGNTGIIVIAATNRPDVLDVALLRPGRFDRQVVVDLPTYTGRLEILKVHARTKKLADEVSLESVARGTPGFSGADLANLLNEAAILTARRRKEAVTMLEINDAIDRVTIGLTRTPLLDSKKKRIVAYHEIGHALLMTLLANSDPLDKVTIIPRSGGIGGFAKPIINDEISDPGRINDLGELYLPRNWVLDQITVALGGRAAEEEVFGNDEVTVGASGDIQAVADRAREMVTRYGMSDLGLLSLERNSNQMMMGALPQRFEYSEELVTKIDRQIRSIVFHCHQRARQILHEHRSLMDRLVEMLIDQETIEGEQFRQIVAQYQQEKGSPNDRPLSEMGIRNLHCVS